MTGSALSYLGDAVYTLRIREYYLEKNYHSPKTLQTLTNRYNSAKGQMKAYERLMERGFFTKEEEEYFRKGRNAIRHIPKNGDRVSYEIASGLEAVTGYLYLCDKERLEEMFEVILEGGDENE